MDMEAAGDGNGDDMEIVGDDDMTMEEVHNVIKETVEKMSDGNNMVNSAEVDTVAEVTTAEVSIDEVIAAEQLIKVTEAEDVMVAKKLLAVKDQLTSKT